MSPPTNAVLLARIESIHADVREIRMSQIAHGLAHQKGDVETERRLSRVETRLSLMTMLGGAISAALAALGGAPHLKGG